MKKLLLLLLTILFIAPPGKAVREEFYLNVGISSVTKVYGADYTMYKFDETLNSENDEFTTKSYKNVSYLKLKKENGDEIKISFEPAVAFITIGSSNAGIKFAKGTTTKITIEAPGTINWVTFCGPTSGTTAWTSSPFLETAMSQDTPNVGTSPWTGYKYTPTENTNKIEVNINNTTDTYLYLNRIYMSLSQQIEAPTFDPTGLSLNKGGFMPAYYDGAYHFIVKYPIIRNGMIVAPEGVKKDSNNIPVMYYTFDGTEPTVASSQIGSRDIQLTEEIPFGETAILKIRALDETGDLGKTLTIPMIRERIEMPEIRINNANVLQTDGVTTFTNPLSVSLVKNPESLRDNQTLRWRISTTNLGQNIEEISEHEFVEGQNGTLPNFTVGLGDYMTDGAGRMEPDKEFYIHAYVGEMEEGNYTVYGSEVAVRAFKWLQTESFDDIAALKENSEDNNGKLVTLECPLMIQGVFSTALPNTDYLYVTDPTGNSIKIVSNGNISKAFPTDYKASEMNANDLRKLIYTIPARGVVGRYRHNDGFVEIEVRNSDADFMPYLDRAMQESTSANKPDKYKPAGALSMADFNGHRVLSGMIKQPGNFVADKDGNIYPVIDRLKTGVINWSEDDNGKRYYIECFIGQYDAQLAIFPVKMLTDVPRPVASFVGGNVINEADGVVRVINPQVSLNLAPEYEGVKVEYQHSSDGVNWINTGRNTFTVTENEDYEFWVRSVGIETGTVSNEPLHLTFRYYKADEVESLSAFKSEYLDDATGDMPAGDIEEKYFRMTGDAVIEEITPYYIYVRDNTANPGSYNHLLIYNSNGWTNAPLVPDATQGTRALRAGDIITGFALKADRTPQGNLRANATGFARTFALSANSAVDPVEYLDERDVDYENAASDDFFEKITFGKSDRMMHYTFKNVLVGRRPNPDYATAPVVVTDDSGNEVRYSSDRMAPEDIVDEYVYTLKLGAQNTPDEITGLDIRFNVFTGKRGGWLTSYDATREGEVNYTVSGVIVRDELRGNKSGYSIAMLDFDLADHAKAPAAIYIDGAKDSAPDADGVVGYIHAGVVKIDKAADADPRAVIYYTLDGTDPKSNRLRKEYDESAGITLPDDERTVTVRAFASWPGAAPSAEVSAIFRRLSEERTYILNFINDAKEGVPYHFNGTVKVAAVGGQYMFVRGVAGHYLPIHRESADETFSWSKDLEGQYLTDFVIGVDRVGDRVRGAKVTDDYSRFMSQPLGTAKPDAIANEINIEPDRVTEITADNARRLVTISNVTLEGVEFEQEAALQSTAWTLTPNKGHDTDKAVTVNHTVLNYEMPAKGTRGHYYNVTGFVMLDAEGAPELWPTAVERVETAKVVKASFDTNAKVVRVGDDDYAVTTYSVDFYPSTVVTLTYDGAMSESAVIRYIFTADDSAPADNEKWNVYGQPFTVTESGYIHAYVEVPGMEESVHTHIELSRMAEAGDVRFDIDTTVAGKATVTMSAAEQGTIIYWTSIDATEKIYSAPIVFEETQIVYARLQVEGKTDGAVSHALVDVASSGKVSGNVDMRIVSSEPGKVVIELFATGNPAPGSVIKYTTAAGAVLPADGIIYTEPIVLTESTTIMAVLLEPGKPAGALLSRPVWVVPVTTGIDGIDGDGENAVRADGDSIIAPEGSEVFDITGRRVNSTGLAGGVYIVRTPDGKAIKVRI